MPITQMLQRLPARTLYYKDRSIGSSKLPFRFQPGAAATRRPASEITAFTEGYTESAVLFDERAIILVTKTFIKCIYKSHLLFDIIIRRSVVIFTSFEYLNSDTIVVSLSID
jgi:hypothetical protein